jgi:hypothetical protein
VGVEGLITSAQIRKRIRRNYWIAVANIVGFGLNVGMLSINRRYGRPVWPQVVGLVLGISAVGALLYNLRQWRDLLGKILAFEKWWAALPGDTRDQIELERRATRELERIHQL